MEEDLGRVFHRVFGESDGAFDESIDYRTSRHAYIKRNEDAEEMEVVAREEP